MHSAVTQAVFALPVVAASEKLDGAGNLLAWPAAVFRASVVLAVAAMRGPLLDIARDDLADLYDLNWQIRLRTVKYAAVEVEAANSVSRIDRASHLDALARPAFAADEFPAVAAMRANFGTESFFIEVEDNRLVEFPRHSTSRQPSMEALLHVAHRGISVQLALHFFLLARFQWRASGEKVADLSWRPRQASCLPELPCSPTRVP